MTFELSIFYPFTRLFWGERESGRESPAGITKGPLVTSLSSLVSLFTEALRWLRIRFVTLGLQPSRHLDVVRYHGIKCIRQLKLRIITSALSPAGSYLPTPKCEIRYFWYRWKGFFFTRRWHRVYRTGPQLYTVSSPERNHRLPSGFNLWFQVPTQPESSFDCSKSERHLVAMSILFFSGKVNCPLNGCRWLLLTVAFGDA